MVDVKLIIVRKGSFAPTAEDLSLLKDHVGAEAAACVVHRKYRKSVESLVQFTVEPKKFRFEDKQLRDWLVPPDRPILVHKRPSEAFLDVAAQSPNLILHPDALKFADELAEHRWSFANNAAVLLGRYAQGDDVGPTQDWTARHGAAHATGGKVSFSCEVSTPDETRRGSSDRHLKAGDNTTRESAARIYFDRVGMAQDSYVIVFYVGPHPDDGQRAVTITITNET